MSATRKRPRATSERKRPPKRPAASPNGIQVSSGRTWIGRLANGSSSASTRSGGSGARAPPRAPPRAAAGRPPRRGDTRTKISAPKKTPPRAGGGQKPKKPTEGGG